MRWGYFKNRIETPYNNYDAYVKELAKTANTLRIWGYNNFLSDELSHSQL